MTLHLSLIQELNTIRLHVYFKLSMNHPAGVVSGRAVTRARGATSRRCCGPRAADSRAASTLTPASMVSEAVTEFKSD